MKIRHENTNTIAKFMTVYFERYDSSVKIRHENTKNIAKFMTVYFERYDSSVNQSVHRYKA